jgi:soluble lytic murein transglycosylase
MLFVVIFSGFFSYASSANQALTETGSSNQDPAYYLSEGKRHLGNGSNDMAIAFLTASYEKLPIMGDYALMWRSQAYENKGDIEDAISDIKTALQKYKDSPLTKSLRTKEIELLKKKQEPSLTKAFEDFLKDYPSDMAVKFSYASYLKNNNEKEKAKRIFKDIFIASAAFSSKAHAELSASDITVEDMIKKAQNLNKSWHFSESEKWFRDALSKNSTAVIKGDIIEGLAYSLFSQKKYKEAYELYKELNSLYWQARSLLRAKEIHAFEARIGEFSKLNDKRIASVLIAYGTAKRRAGDKDGALKLFNELLAKYHSDKEEILWSIGWTHYLAGDYKKALEIFSQLNEIYSDPKYLYWKNRCIELTGASKTVKTFPSKLHHRDFYGALAMLKQNQTYAVIETSPLNVSMSSPAAERVDILSRIGMKKEAASELLALSKKNPDNNMLTYISSSLKDLGSYKASVNLISKIPYRGELHGLFYPNVFPKEVSDAAKRNDIDPLLILSVMREESRFDNEARSIAGALGLMQLMPQTAAIYKKSAKTNYGRTEELYKPEINISIGAHYLKHLVKTFNSTAAAIAAYNAGEEAVKNWLRNGSYESVDEFIEDIPYSETRNYVKRVLNTYFEYLKASKNSDIDIAIKSIGKL